MGDTQECKVGLTRQMSRMGNMFLQGTWPAEMNMLEPTINVLSFFDQAPELEALANDIEKHLWPCYRFHSCMENGKWVRRHAQIDRDYHFRQVKLDGEKDIEPWVQKSMFDTLDRKYPPWQCTILHAPTGERSAIWMQIHHSVGDGIGLLFAFAPMLRCASGDPLDNIPLPSRLLPPSKRKPEDGQAGSLKSGGIRAFFRGMLVAALAKADTELSINPPLKDREPFLRFNGNRKYQRFRAMPLQKIKEIRVKHACSVNDVLLAALTGAMRRYGAEEKNDPKLKDGGGKVEFKIMMMMALPRKLVESDLAGSLANKVLFASCPLPIDQPTPKARLDGTIASTNKLKDRSYMGGLIGFTHIACSTAPVGFLRKAAAETFSKHSMLVTQIPGFSVPISVFGREVKEMQMVFPNIIPQLSIMTYNGFVFANLVADPTLIQAEKFEEYWWQEFEALAAA